MRWTCRVFKQSLHCRPSPRPRTDPQAPPMVPPTLRLVLAALLLARAAGSLVLDALNRAETRRGGRLPPGLLDGIQDPQTRARAARYTLDKSRLASVSTAWETAVAALLLLGGGLGPLRAWTGAAAAPGAAWADAAFLMAAMGAASLLALPLEAWGQFRVEARHGFNRMTPALWWADQAKGALVGLVLGFPLLWAIMALVRRAGASWWIWGFALVAGFQLVLIPLYPRLILPLFNRLSPLPEGALRDRLAALVARAGLRVRAIEVIDGSRRSAHSNAFFTGFGRFRRIVLYDTLVSQLDAPALEAVVAHEIGHGRLGHIPRMAALGLALLLAGFAGVARVVALPALGPALGLPPGDPAAGMAACLFAGGALLFWAGPLARVLSRRHEFQADAYAARLTGGPDGLVAALRTLSRDNLGNLTPHPWYAAFHHSHPTVAEREAALSGRRP